MLIIGTPIRDIKEYAIEKWLNSVREFDADYFLYMVDNSDTPDFAKRVEKLAKGINFEILHLENMQGLDSEERLSQSREKIREKMLAGDFKIWFSWECDIILPPNAYQLMRSYLKEFDVVNHNYPDRYDKMQEVGGIGISFYKRHILEKFSFLKGYGQCDERMPNNWFSGDSYLVYRTLWDGHKMIDLHNLFKCEHLGE